MRRSSYPFLTIVVAVIASGASAVAPAAKHAAQPALRAASTGTTTVPVQKTVVKTVQKTVVKTVQKPMHQAVLRVSTPIVIAAKKPAPKTAMKTKIAAKYRPAHKQVAMHRSTTISVPLDEVRVVAFSQPVSTIYVGNPIIADVSMIDSRHAFVLGKGFGATNVVALDADGKQVVNDAVNVYGHNGSIVILHRGVAQATYNCAGARCEAAPVPGDGKDAFASGMEQMTQHQTAGVQAASAAH